MSNGRCIEKAISIFIKILKNAIPSISKCFAIFNYFIAKWINIAVVCGVSSGVFPFYL
jgi:hypothetical protein